MILRCLYLLAAVLPLAFADVEITSPAAGASVTGTTLNIQWKDSGDQPPITDLVSYQMFLCAGGNDPDNYVCD